MTLKAFHNNPLRQNIKVDGDVIAKIVNAHLTVGGIVD
jgi:hypothetical protein